MINLIVLFFNDLSALQILVNSHFPIIHLLIFVINKHEFIKLMNIYDNVFVSYC